MSSSFTKNELIFALKGNKTQIRKIVEMLTPVIQARVARALVAWTNQKNNSQIKEEVSDISQEIFASLFKNNAKILLNWDPNKGLSLKNYVGLVAHRHALSWLRSKKRNSFNEDPTEFNELESLNKKNPNLENQITSRNLLTIVFKRTEEGLSPTGQHLFELLFLKECSIPEITKETGMSDSAIYAWKSRLGKTLKQHYNHVLSENTAQPRKSSRMEAL